MRKKTGKKKNSSHFWNKEYNKGGHLELSDEPSEDMIKFLRFIDRKEGKKQLNVTTSALDLGCGNGRNLIFLAKSFGMRGVGYDISDVAIEQAKGMAGDLPVQFEARSITGALDVPDSSQAIVLDMMSSHFLREEERRTLVSEIARVLKTSGWFYFKTFLLDEDRHASRLIHEHPGDEENSYIHPEIGIQEHVFTIDEIEDLLSPNFTIHKISKSHRHLKKGRAFKRRSVSVYAQKLG